MARKQAKLYGAGFFGLFGVMFLAIGACWLVIAAVFVSRATPADGRIVSLIKVPGDDGPTYKPRFTFDDAAGKSHTVVSSWGANPPAYAVNDPVDVLYLPGKPESAVIDSFMSLWLIPSVMLSVGTILALASYVFTRWMGQRNRNAGEQGGTQVQP